jgi:hypothetical protein
VACECERGGPNTRLASSTEGSVQVRCTRHSLCEGVVAHVVSNVSMSVVWDPLRLPWIASAYTVLWGKKMGNEWSQHSLSVPMPGSTSAVVDDLVLGSEYRVCIEARTNNGSTSSCSSWTFLVLAVAPSSPRAVSVSFMASTGSEMVEAVATWQSPREYCGTSITSYVVSDALNGTVFAQIVGDDASSNHYAALLRGVSLGVPYSIAVTAVAEVNNEELRSPAASTLFSVTAPSQPLGVLVGVSGQIGNRTLDLDVSWQPPTSSGGAPLQGYTVQYASRGACSMPANGSIRGTLSTSLTVKAVRLECTWCVTVCARGAIASLPSKAACLSPESQRVVLRSQCAALPQSYAVVSTGQCAACPPHGARCDHGVLTIDDGWWHVPTSDGRVALVECLDTSSCRTNGSALTQCGVGRHGVLCGVCDGNWARNGPTCVQCWPWWASFVFCIGVGIVGVVVLAVFVQHKTFGPRSEATVMLRLLLTFLQLLSCLLLFRRHGTSLFHEVVHVAAGAASGSAVGLFPLSCLVGGGFWVRFAAILLSPIIMCVVVWGVAWLRHRRDTSLGARIQAMCLFVLFTLYPTLVATVASAFRCTTPVAGLHSSYLEADVRVVCGSSEHVAGLVVAVIAGLVYGVGFPLVVCVVVLHGFGRLRVPDFAMRFSFLYDGYRLDSRLLAAWEAVVLLEKYALVLVSAVITNSTTQQVAGALVLLVTLAVQLEARPFAVARHNRIAAALLLSLCVTQVLCIFYVTQQSTFVLTWLLVTMNGGVVVWLVGLILWAWGHDVWLERRGRASTSMKWLGLRGWKNKWKADSSFTTSLLATPSADSVADTTAHEEK